MVPNVFDLTHISSIQYAIYESRCHLLRDFCYAVEQGGEYHKRRPLRSGERAGNLCSRRQLTSLG